MNYADLGRRVKEKYPDYQGVDDEELGRKVAAKYPEYEAQIDKGNAITNFFPSLGRVATDTIDAGINAFNPDPEQNTIANLSRLLEGGLRKTDNIPVLGDFLRAQTGGEAIKRLNAENPYFDSSEQVADAAGQFYADRYSSPEQAWQTFNEDPVGVLLDASTVLTGGGSLATKVGTASKVSKAAKVGKVVSATGRAIDPVGQLLNVPGKAIELAGQSRVGRALQKPFAGSYNAQIDDLAKQYGIDAPVSMTNRSNVLRQGEAIAQKSVFGSPVQKKIQATRDRIGQLSDDLTAREVRSTDLAGTGSDIKKGFSEFQDTFREQKSAMYEAVTPEVSKSPGVFTKTEQALQEILDSKSGSLASGTNAAYYQEILTKLRRGGEAIDDVDTGILDASGNPIIRSQTTPSKLTIDNIRKTRTQVGEKLKNHNDPIATGDTASLKKLYAALSDDLDDSIRAVDPAAGQALDEANAYYRDTIQKINSRVGKNIENRNPEKLVDDLIKPNSETDIALVREIVGEEAFGRLQTEFMQKIFNNSMKTVTDAQGNRVQRLDYATLSKQLDRYGDPTLKKLLTPDQYQRLKNVQGELERIDQLDRAFKSGTKAADGSQTGFLLDTGAMGLLLHNPALLAQYVGSRYGMAKLFSTGAGANLLNRGIDVTTPVANTLQRASRPAGATARIGNLIGTTQDDTYQRALQRVMERDRVKSQSANTKRLP